MTEILMNMCEGLGYSRLSPQEQQAYKILLKAFASMSTSFDSSPIAKNVDLMKVLQVVLGDNPNVVYFNKTEIKISSSLLGKQIRLMGCPSKSQILKMNAELESKANAIISTIRGGDEYSQLIKLYEYLQNNMKYDEQELQEILKRGSGIRQNSHNAYGALINGLAVCDGFSGAFALLAQRLGYKCMFVSGRSTNRLMGAVDHIWNIVKVNNRCYHLDVTWDTTLGRQGKDLSYEYFALTDEEIASDHDWDINTTPACSYNDFSFFLRNGLYANSTGQLRDMFKTSSKNRRLPIRVKLSYNISLPPNADEYLCQMALEEAVKTGTSAQLEYTWNEHTRCFFARFVS